MNKVKGYRNMCNMTQDELAAELGLTRETYNKKEVNDTFTKVEKLALVTVFNSKGLNVTSADIFFN